MFGLPPLHSIATRLFVSATVLIASILLVSGAGLTALNRRLSEASFDDRLGVYVKALIAEGLTANDETRTTPAAQIDPLFELAFSGWYWQVVRLDVQPKEMRASPSLFATQLPLLDANAPTDSEGIVAGYVIGPGEKRLRAIERTIDAGDEGRYLVEVAASDEVIEKQIASFETALWATFLALALAYSQPPHRNTRALELELRLTTNGTTAAALLAACQAFIQSPTQQTFDPFAN